MENDSNVHIEYRLNDLPADAPRSNSQPPAKGMNKMKTFQTRRQIAASSKALFATFQDIALLTKWWGPKGFTTTSALFDFKPKGLWKFVMHGPDGQDYPNEMIFEDIAAPHKIVMRHSVEPHFTLTVTIEDNKDGAILHWHQEFDSEEVANNMAHIVKPANEQNLDKLAALVAKV